MAEVGRYDDNAPGSVSGALCISELGRKPMSTPLLWVFEPPAVAERPGELVLRIDRGGTAEGAPLICVPFSLALRVWDAFEAATYAALVQARARVPAISGPTVHEAMPQLMMAAAHASAATTGLVH